MAYGYKHNDGKAIYTRCMLAGIRVSLITCERIAALLG